MQVTMVLSFVAAVVMTVSADSFSAEDQAIWIDRHNYFRTTGLPWSAGNMRRIGWDDDLATTAASTATKCSATTAAAVNVYQSSSSNSSSVLDEAIQQWVVETSMSTLSTLSQPGATGQGVGTGTYNSYSQVLWASTTSVGCATASCSDGEMVVCQYSPAGNDGTSAWYVHADTASDCPSGTTASSGLCIVEGDSANDQIAAIPTGELTYEVYPAYVANMQTVLIEAARAVANGSAGTSTNSTETSTGSNTTSTKAPTSTTATPSATTATPTSTTATPTSTSSKTSTTNSKGSSSDSTSSTTNPKKTTSSSSSSKGESSSSTKKSGTTSSSESDTDSSTKSSTKQKSKTTSSSSDDSSPGTVKASSDSGSAFTNQATSSQSESKTSQTSTTSGSTTTASAPSTDSTTTESTTPTTSGSSTAISANNQSTTAANSGLSAAGITGMIILAVVLIAAVGVVMSYRKNQQRQREIMRDGGIRII